MRDSTFVLIIIMCVVLLMMTVQLVLAQEIPKKQIKYIWSWDTDMTFCFFTEKYMFNSVTAVTKWNQALGDNFTSSYRFVQFGDNIEMCNVFVLFYKDALYKDGSRSLGYADCRFNNSVFPYCIIIINTERDFNYQFDMGYSITTTIMHEIGHVYGLSHSQTYNLTEWCIDDIMHTPHCIKTLQILPFHVKAIECRYGEDGFGIPNYHECKAYEEYVE